MKIVDRKTFLSLPAGTVYSKYAPCFFDGLAIKCSDPNDGRSNDFLYDDLIAPVDAHDSDEFCAMCENAEHGKLIPLTFTENTSRDGLFENEQLFAIYEDADVVAMILRLSECVKPDDVEAFDGR